MFDQIQCSVVITRPIFSTSFITYTHGVSVMSFKSNSYSAAVVTFVAVRAVACVTSQQIGPRYNGTGLSYVDHNTQQNSARIHLYSLTVA